MSAMIPEKGRDCQSEFFGHRVHEISWHDPHRPHPWNHIFRSRRPLTYLYRYMHIDKLERCLSISHMTMLGKDSDKCLRGAEILKAIGHPLRLQIIAVLCGRQENVNDLAKHLGVAQAIVSQQLRILRAHRLVAATRKNGFARYRLTEPHLRTMIRCMERCLGVQHR
jgi:DNA-binding transcriptional ArsR family regulator